MQIAGNKCRFCCQPNAKIGGIDEENRNRHDCGYAASFGGMRQRWI